MKRDDGLFHVPDESGTYSRLKPAPTVIPSNARNPVPLSLIGFLRHENLLQTHSKPEPTVIPSNARNPVRGNNEALQSPPGFWFTQITPIPQRVHADFADFADLKDKKIRCDKETRWARYGIR